MRNIKKFEILVFLTIMIMMISQVALSIDSPTLKATLLRYEPTPAQAGDYVTVYIQVENNGNSVTSNAKIEFIDNYPFSIDDVGDKAKNLGKLGIGQTTVLDFKVRVDEKAVLGENIIKFKLSDLSITSQEKLFTINVKPLSADLRLKNIEVTPLTLSPGDSAVIKISLKNTESSTLSQITSKLSTISVQGSTITDIPFAIEDSISKKTISVIRSGDEDVILYAIKSYPTIKPGIYKLPLVLDYYDGSGENYSKTEFVTIIINPKVDAYVAIDGTTLTSENKVGNVVFKVVNKGFGDIQFTNLMIDKSNDFELLSPYNQVYIGSIDSDDYKTGEFKINVNKDNVELPVVVTFKDSLNKEHTLNQVLSLKLLNKSQTGQKSSNTVWMILIAVLVIIGIVWYMRRKNKRK